MEIFTFLLSITAYTCVLLWGAKIIQTSIPDQLSIRRLLMVKDDQNSPDPENDVPSFGRHAAALGLMGLAGVLIGVGYYVIYALFYTPENLKNLAELKTYFLAGSALFAPYAFTKLKEVFGGIIKT